ncbi:MAG: hypothetical protein IJZ17_01955, partial [Muribaculaceae bacterium]|nr:hypothetical protein [Muribaculaceae bacterium]
TGIWEMANAGETNSWYSETLTEYADGYDAKDGCKTLLVDYIPATSSTTDDIWHFNVTVEFENGEPFARTFAMDIPVRRNHLTTIIGDFFTAESNLDVYIDETIDNVITTVDGLTTKFANLKAGDETVISIGADLIIENGTTLSIPAGATVTLDLGNSTLSNNVANAPALINEGTLIIKNGVLYNGSTVDGVSSAPQDALVNKGGTVIIENGVIGSNDGIGSAIESYGGEVIIKDGTFYAADRNTYTNNAAYAFNFYQEAKVTIYNATVDCAPNGIFFVDNSEVTIHDGYYALGGAPNNYYWAYLKNGGKMKVLAGTCKFTGSDNCIWPIYDGGVLCLGNNNTIPTNALFSSDCTFEGKYWNGFTGNMTVAEVSTTEALATSITEENAYINVSAGEYTFPTNFAEGVTLVCEEGTVFTGQSNPNINGATIDGATFSNDSGSAVRGTVNGVYKNCTFTGENGLRWCYTGETVRFENCVFSGSTYGAHFDSNTSTGSEMIFEGCTFSGFNDFGSTINLTLTNCTFKGNGTSAYNGANLWGNTTMKNCEFTFDGSTGTEWIDCIGPDKTYTFDGCSVNGEAYTNSNYTEFTKIESRNNIIVNIDGVDCQL